MRIRGAASVASVGLLAGGVVLAACGGDDGNGQATADGSVAGTVTVFAAASLTGAFEEIGDAFELANPDVDVTFSFAGSSDLVAQINEGAPADVFASADANNMNKLVDAAGNVGEPVVFAQNTAEVIVAPGNPLAIDGLDDLVDPSLILVVCAPEVPCGNYAATIFDNAGIAPTPDSYEQNVSGVVNKVVVGEADAGIVYATDVIAAGSEAAGVPIPADVNVVAEYPLVLTADAPNPAAGAAFVEFVLGSEGQQILNRFGFASP